VFSGRYGREIKNLASEALEQFKQEPLNEKVVERLLKDLKTRMQFEQLRQKRKEYSMLQQQCESQDEVNYYLGQIGEIDRELQQLKS
jgi:hypothetical protein